jgi:hypothetical protein
MDRTRRPHWLSTRKEPPEAGCYSARCSLQPRSPKTPHFQSLRPWSSRRVRSEPKSQRPLQAHHPSTIFASSTTVGRCPATRPCRPLSRRVLGSAIPSCISGAISVFRTAQRNAASPENVDPKDLGVHSTPARSMQGLALLVVIDDDSGSRPPRAKGPGQRARPHGSSSA